MEPSGEAAGFASLLASRRMCRDYLPEPLSPQLLAPVLDAAFSGPAAGNTWALDLLVLTGDDVRTYWDTSLDPARRADFPWPGLLQAPVLVVPYVDPDAYATRYAEPDKSHTGLGAGTERWTVPYWWIDGGAAVMAMLLAAEAAGLGALLFGQFDHEADLRSVFGVPAGRRALGTVALGRAAGARTGSASARRGRPDPATRTHTGRW